MQAVETTSAIKPRNPIEGRAFWEMWVKKCEQSPSSRKAFCRENGLNYDRFQYWRHKFKNEQKSNQPLLPVKVIAAPAVPGALCTLELQSGHRLLFHGAAGLEQLLQRVC